MARYSYTVAIAKPLSEFGVDADPKEMVGGQTEDENFVYTHSLRGVIFSTLREICMRSPIGTDLYLLKQSAVLEGDDIRRAAESIRVLLAAIEKNPDIVLEATKIRHETTTEISAAGLDRFGAQVVYSGSASARDGWTYIYDRDEVRAFLQSALSSSDPCPGYDDEGEGLEYVFGVLKSHRSLLHFAAESGFAFAFAELN